jgi:hypothetical protein
MDAAYLQALALTLAIELPIYTTVLVAWQRVRPWRALTAGVSINLATHPAVWFVWYPLLVPGFGNDAYVVIAELFAWWAEALLLWAWLRRDLGGLVVLSLVANGASFLAGELFLYGQ